MSVALLRSAFVLLLAALLPSARAADYQWSVPVEAVLATETGKAPRAWLWVPPSAKQVRAVIVGQHNLLEETVLEHPIIRRAAADNDFAIVWVSPAFDSLFRPDHGAGAVFDAMMKALAEVSGYAELATAPVVPIGHSAMAGYPYQFAAWAPERTLAAISIKGNHPDFRQRGDYDFDNSRLEGVPLLFISGEFEDADGRSAKSAAFRKRFPRVPLTVLADSGGGHFDFHDRLANYLELYLRKIAGHRLPPRASPPSAVPVKLVPIDPTRTGWLYDRFRRDAQPQAAPAPLASYAGPADESLWALDEELARATHDYAAKYRLTRPQLVGYLQNGEPILPTPGRHEGVLLKMNPVDDGATFKLSGVILDTVPEAAARPDLPAGSPVGHVADPGPVSIDVITGPLKKTGPDTFAVRFGRIGFDNGKRSGGIWLQATLDGDATYKRAVQQAALNIPIRNTGGAPQTLAFEPIPDQRAGLTSLPLRATASSGAPVSYYVLEGPAEIDGATLRFTNIPPRAKPPVKVTVVAYQWGRPSGDRLQSAEPVARSFYLLAPGERAPDPTRLTRERAVLDAIWAEAAEKIAALPAVASAGEKPAAYGRAYSFDFAQNLPLAPEDLAGHPAPVARWQAIVGLQPGKTVQLRNVPDSAGEIGRLTVAVTGGATPPGAASLLERDKNPAATAGDARLFNAVYDQTDGEPTVITVFGIPYDRYDVVFYRADDGPGRAGRFQVGNRVLHARGGKSGNPGLGSGALLVANDATYGRGSDIAQGNVVRFENLVGDRFTASFKAVPAGDDIRRNKVAGFQIIERK
ncbi:MAG: hypothetical protein MUE42_01090 [Opitutaceae bacterium]|jgi:hypothetical protein|nr:hypothetical protein [Opitutaceae bacterium]